MVTGFVKISPFLYLIHKVRCGGHMDCTIALVVGCIKSVGGLFFKLAGSNF